MDYNNKNKHNTTTKNIIQQLIIQTKRTKNKIQQQKINYTIL